MRRNATYATYVGTVVAGIDDAPSVTDFISGIQISELTIRVAI